MVCCVTCDGECRGIGVVRVCGIFEMYVVYDVCMDVHVSEALHYT